MIGLSLAGCSAFGSPIPSGRTVRDVYESSPGGPTPALSINAAPLPGREPLTRPVIYPPKVFAVWVPEHLDLERDLKIGAHWVFMKLRDSSWLEEPIDREPPLAGQPLASGDVARIKSAFGNEAFSKILVPQAIPGDGTKPAESRPGEDR